jgi:hypothetical protein
VWLASSVVEGAVRVKDLAHRYRQRSGHGSVENLSDTVAP